MRANKFQKCTHKEKYESISIPSDAFAYRLFELAGEYGEAARYLLSRDSEAWKAAYFLLCHSLELLLKSFLAAKGVISNSGENQFKEHCLVCLWSLAKDYGLQIEIEKINLLIEHIKDYTELVRYPDVEFKQRIDPGNILELQEVLAQVINAETFVALFDGMFARYDIINHWHDRSLSAREDE